MRVNASRMYGFLDSTKSEKDNLEFPLNWLIIQAYLVHASSTQLTAAYRAWPLIQSANISVKMVSGSGRM